MPRKTLPSEETPQPEARDNGSMPARIGRLVFYFIIGMMTMGSQLGTAIAAFRGVGEKSRQVQACNNARQIIISVHAYAKDHEGKYPGGNTANVAFGELFRGGYVDDERIFSAPASPYVADNKVGKRPTFEDALSRGENHWAMTKGVTSTGNGNIPLIFENPALSNWPPEWNADIAGQPKPGRAWRGGKVIVGRNDGSVAVEKLTTVRGLTSLIPIEKDKNLFELAGPHEVLDVEK